MAKPKVVVIAGPNGAGKSTAAAHLLPVALGIREFVNADQIAAGLSAYAPEKVAFEAGRFMLGRLRVLAEKKVSFAFESTLSSRSFAPFLARLKREGYEVRLFYVYLDSAGLANQRVALRVAEGGHAIPKADVTRRFGRSLANLFELYLPLADRVDLFDNSDGKLTRIATCKAHPSGMRVQIRIPSTWQTLQRQAERFKRRKSA